MHIKPNTIANISKFMWTEILSSLHGIKISLGVLPVFKSHASNSIQETNLVQFYE